MGIPKINSFLKMAFFTKMLILYEIFLFSRLFLDVDCTYINGDGFTNKGNITEILTGAMQAGDKIFTKEEVKQ